MTNGIAAVQARIGELRQLVEPQRTLPTTTSTKASATASTATSFTDALAALGLSDTAVPTTTASAGPTGQSLIAAAEKYVGTPYVWGGESLSEGGLDCSGLVQRSLADIGVTGIPRTAREQMTLGSAVPDLDQALPGDLLVFNGGSHIAIYVGDGKMIDAPKPGGHVSVRDVYKTPSAIRRVLPQETAAPSAGTPTSGVTSASATASAQRATLEALQAIGSTSSAPGGYAALTAGAAA
ncbi:C40 family peptidase [Cellulomonas sp. URHD0024]|uniref:C40 family peptidase n=1 Tax=Cellulomonas sp. URHD0024 TaxID=1302620 RepID=UPI00042A0D05|nr:C40 family peptidase [Cellulomonas sp. URHD0024]